MMYDKMKRKPAFKFYQLMGSLTSHTTYVGMV